MDFTGFNDKESNRLILADKRFRNGVRNCKVTQNADCDSDHKPVVSTIAIKLKRESKGVTKRKWNLAPLLNTEVREEYASSLNSQLIGRNISENEEVDKVWDQIKECVNIVAEEICGTKREDEKQKWMTCEILELMEERRLCLADESEKGRKQ